MQRHPMEEVTAAFVAKVIIKIAVTNLVAALSLSRLSSSAAPDARMRNFSWKQSGTTKRASGTIKNPGSVARGYPAAYLVPNRFPDRSKTESAALHAAAHDYHDFADPDQIMSESTVHMRFGDKLEIRRFVMTFRYETALSIPIL